MSEHDIKLNFVTYLGRLKVLGTPAPKEKFLNKRSLISQGNDIYVYLDKQFSEEEHS